MVEDGAGCLGRKTGAPRVATKPPADLDLRPHRVERHQENPAEETCRLGFLPHRPITLAVRVRAARACRDECLVLRCVGPRHRDEANDLRIAVHLEAALVVGARSRRKEEPPRCKRRLRCGRSWRRHGLPPCSHALRRKGRAIEREQPSRFSGSFGANKKEGAERWRGAVEFCREETADTPSASARCPRDRNGRLLTRGEPDESTPLLNHRALRERWRKPPSRRRPPSST